MGPDQIIAQAVKGDLAGYVIMRHGTDDPVFDARDLEMLKDWFEKGMPSGGQVMR
jgi:3-deoxy-D-arabino-heptulosonate 7-phosphate (DAHP) synthase